MWLSELYIQRLQRIELTEPWPAPGPGLLAGAITLVFERDAVMCSSPLRYSHCQQGTVTAMFDGHTPILAISTLGIVFALWGLYAFAAWAFKGHAAFIPVAALAVYAVWLLIKRLLAAQAACLLGVVVDQQAGAITFPTFLPALRTVPLAEIAQLTREDGNKLHIAGEFGSYSLRFSDKRRRDECIYLLKSRTGAKMLAELE